VAERHGDATSLLGAGFTLTAAPADHAISCASGVPMGGRSRELQPACRDERTNTARAAATQVISNALFAGLALTIERDTARPRRPCERPRLYSENSSEIPKYSGC
jgi:hypothetical protein